MPTDANSNDATEAATATLRDAVKTLEADEARLTRELAEAKAKRKAVAKALQTLTGESAPRRGRGRPRTRPATS